MKKYKDILFYFCMLAGLGVVMYFILKEGSLLNNLDVVMPNGNSNQWKEFTNGVAQNFATPLATILAQIITILIVSRALSWVFKKIGQPGVIGEIIAGIVLGPSLIGSIFPDFFNFIFPESSFNNLKTLSNIGLILFMFVVGMELDMRFLRMRGRQAVVISHTGIVFPFVLGIGLSFFLFESLAPQGVPFQSFALFMGISMSITAFPVLARIIQERGLNQTKFGNIIISCAAVDDISAWCLLAVVIAVVKAGSLVSSLFTIGAAVLYIVLMFAAVRPFLKRISDLYSSRENLSKSVVAIFFLVLIFSALCTELIGIHALFGAFVAGVIMPEKKSFRSLFVDKVEDIALVLLLPLFFVFTGLRTKIGLLNDPNLWLLTGLIIVVGVVGKFLGAFVASKVVGRTLKESLMIGTLMNTRGLMELVVINIGYDMGVLSPEIFAMMVIMALVTTFMTSPLLSLIDKIFPDKEKKQELEKQQIEGVFKVLIAVGNPKNGKYFLRIAKTVLDGSRNVLGVTALHVTEGSEMNPLRGEQYEKESFEDIDNEAKTLGLTIKKEYVISDNVAGDIVNITNEDEFDFLLFGSGISYAEIPFLKDSSLFGKIKWLNRIINSIARRRILFYPQTMLRDKTRFFKDNTNCTTGMFINRGFSQVTTTVIMLALDTDDYLLRYARRLLQNSSDVTVAICDVSHLTKTNNEIADAIALLQAEFPNSIKVQKKRTQLNKYSLMLISHQTWSYYEKNEPNELKFIPSTLIINKKTSRFTRRSDAYHRANGTEED